jgi:hypothetical protein
MLPPSSRPSSSSSQPSSSPALHALPSTASSMVGPSLFPSVSLPVDVPRIAPSSHVNVAPHISTSTPSTLSQANPPSSSPPPYSSASMQSRAVTAHPPSTSSGHPDLNESLLSSLRRPISPLVSGAIDSTTCAELDNLSWTKGLSDKELEDMVAKVISSEGFDELVSSSDPPLAVWLALISRTDAAIGRDMAIEGNYLVVRRTLIGISLLYNALQDHFFACKTVLDVRSLAPRHIVRMCISCAMYDNINRGITR